MALTTDSIGEKQGGADDLALRFATDYMYTRWLAPKSMGINMLIPYFS